MTMLYSTHLGRPIPETADEQSAHLWLHADDRSARATAAAHLDGLHSNDLALLLARVSSAERTCRPELLNEIQKAFGTEVRAAFEEADSEIVNIGEVQRLLQEVSRDELLASAAALYSEDRPDEAFDILRAIGAITQREIAEFVRVVGAEGGSALGAAQWLALQFASSRLVGCQVAERF